MKLRMVRYSNGNFAICPRCGKTMARSMAGYWDCICGCGMRVPTAERAKMERAKSTSKPKI